VDEPGPIKKFGFAYGTLPGHVESGEDRIVIEWDQGDNIVHYDILAFSRPSHILTRLGYPAVRRMQKRFGRDSALAVFKSVNGESSIPEISPSDRMAGIFDAVPNMIMFAGHFHKWLLATSEGRSMRP